MILQVCLRRVTAGVLEKDLVNKSLFGGNGFRIRLTVCADWMLGCEFGDVPYLVFDHDPTVVWTVVL